MFGKDVEIEIEHRFVRGTEHIGAPDFVLFIRRIAKPHVADERALSERAQASGALRQTRAHRFRSHWHQGDFGVPRLDLADLQRLLETAR